MLIYDTFCIVNCNTLEVILFWYQIKMSKNLLHWHCYMLFQKYNLHLILNLTQSKRSSEIIFTLYSKRWEGLGSLATTNQPPCSLTWRQVSYWARQITGSASFIYHAWKANGPETSGRNTQCSFQQINCVSFLIWQDMKITNIFM